MVCIVCVVSDTEKPLLPDGIWTDSIGWSTKMWHQSCQDVLLFFSRSYGKKCIWILVPTCDSYQVTLARQTGLPFVRGFLLNLHLRSSSFWQDYFKSQNLLGNGFNVVKPTINHPQWRCHIGFTTWYRSRTKNRERGCGDGKRECHPGQQGWMIPSNLKWFMNCTVNKAGAVMIGK